MGILSGYKKFKKYLRTTDGYQLCSEWTNADSVEMADGSTLQESVSSLNEEVASLNEDITSLNGNLADRLGGITFGVDDDGNYGYIKAGADTVTPFKNKGIIYNIGTYNPNIPSTFNLKGITGWENFTNDNFIIGFGFTQMAPVNGNNTGCVFELSRNYNNTTGILTITRSANATVIWGNSFYPIYLLVDIERKTL